MSQSAIRAERGAVGGLVLMIVLHVGVLTTLAACSSTLPKDKHADSVATRVLPPPTPRTEGAIYQAGQEMALFADLKARRVGDVLTIVLNESTNASKSAVTKTTKSSATADTGPSLLGKSIVTKGVPILTTTLSGSNTFDGEGSSTQGKSLRLNQGDELIHISGVIRPADIATNNTVTSDKLADARISYSGKGVIDNSNRMGWLTRFFNSAFAPL